MTDYVAGSLSALFSKNLSSSDGNDGNSVKLTHVKQMYEEFEPRKAPTEVGKKLNASQKDFGQESAKRKRVDVTANASSKRSRSIYKLPQGLEGPGGDSTEKAQEDTATNVTNRNAALLRISRKTKGDPKATKGLQNKAKKSGKDSSNGGKKNEEKGSFEETAVEVDGKRDFRYYEDDPTYIPRTIFVKNLPPKTQRKQMKKLFANCGDILFVRFANAVPMKSSIPVESALKKRSLIKEGTTICAYIVFADISSVAAALQLNGIEFAGHHLRVDKREPSSVPPKRSVFCGNLTFNTTDDQLWEFFAEAGEIDYVRVVRDNLSGEGKGIAFVVFKDSSAALMALEFSGKEFNGRPIRVTAIEKKQSNATSHGMNATSRNVQVGGSKERINKKKMEKKSLKQERKLKGPKEAKMGKQKREKLKKTIKREKMTKFKKNFAKKLQGIN